MNVENVYNAVKEVFDISKPIYEDYIIYLVGFEGLYILIENGLVEVDSIINGRRSYMIRDKE